MRRKYLAFGSILVAVGLGGMVGIVRWTGLALPAPLTLGAPALVLLGLFRVSAVERPAVVILAAGCFAALNGQRVGFQVWVEQAVLIATGVYLIVFDWMHQTVIAQAATSRWWLWVAITLLACAGILLLSP